VVVNGRTIKLSSYFTWRPKHVLGTLALDSGMHGSQTLQVRGDLKRAPEFLNAHPSCGAQRSSKSPSRPPKLDL